MSELYDFRQGSIRRDLDAAFAAGEQRGRAWSDEHLTAECVELRSELWEREARAYRQGIETTAWFVVILAAILVIAWLVLL